MQSEEQIVERIVQLFAQELKIDQDKVNPDTHFIFTGGDSLNTESLIVAVAAEFSLRLKTAVLLDAPTPRALARLVMLRLAQQRPPAVAADLQGANSRQRNRGRGGY